MRFIVVLVSLTVAAACATQATSTTSAHRVVSPEGHSARAEWSEVERRQPYALRNLRRSDGSSFHLLRVKSERPAVVHAGSDAVLFVVSGSLAATLGDRETELAAGDVVELPRGTPYSLKNLAPEPSTVYLTYTPALAADDTRSVVEPRTESAWKWNLWVQ